MAKFSLVSRSEDSTADQVFPHQGVTCNSLAAETMWAQFSRETLDFRLSLCVPSHSVWANPTILAVVGDAEVIQVFVEVHRDSTERMKRQLNWLYENQGYSELVPKKSENKRGFYCVRWNTESQCTHQAWGWWLSSFITTTGTWISISHLLGRNTQTHFPSWVFKAGNWIWKS